MSDGRGQHVIPPAAAGPADAAGTVDPDVRADVAAAPAAPGQVYPQGRVLLALIGLTLSVNIVSHLHRTSPAVVTPEIIREVGLDASSMSMVIGGYTVAAMLAQVPSGVLFDRFGVSRSIPAMMLVGAAGAALFGLAGSAPGLALGRALSGLGCGAMIMGAVVICAQLVPREKFAALVGAVLALGQIGNILGTAPLAHLSAAIGWRASFVGLAALTVAVAGLYAWGMRRAPVGRRIGEVESLGRTLRVTLRIFADRRLWPIFALAFTGYSTMFALIALWFGLYLDALGLDLLGRGNVLFAVAVAFAFGLFLFGRLQLVLHSIKAAVLLGAGGLVALLAVLAALPAPPVALVVALFMLAGVAGGFTGSVISHGGLFYRPAEFGRGVTAMNTLVLAGATAVQFWSGPLFDAVHGLVPGGLAAYRILFAVLALWLAGGLVLYRRAAATPEDFEAGFSKGKTT